jgi:hypothetical protein
VCEPKDYSGKPDPVVGEMPKKVENEKLKMKSGGLKVENLYRYFLLNNS